MKRKNKPIRRPDAVQPESLCNLRQPWYGAYAARIAR